MWDYCQASVGYLFGNKLGNAVADTIVSALRQAPDGLTRTDISGLFNRNIAASRIETALEQIERYGLAYCDSLGLEGRGRPTTRWLLQVTK